MSRHVALHLAEPSAAAVAVRAPVRPAAGDRGAGGAGEAARVADPHGLDLAAASTAAGLVGPMWAGGAAAGGQGPRVLARAATTTRAAVLAGLQRGAGNAAVGRMLHGQRAAHTPPASRSGPGLGLVQRCGGEVHDGCPCADQGAGKAEGEATVQRRVVAASTVQRQPIDLCAPPSPLAESPICKPPVVAAPARYAALHQSLIDLVEASRLRAIVSPGNRYLDNAFRGGKLPRNWVEALDNFDDAGVSALAQNNELAREVSGLWGFLRFIRDTFWSTSQGFNFEARPGLRSFLERHPQMCNDFVVTEQIFHGGASCFRQMGKNNVPGVHVCLHDETHGDIHVDKHQVTTGVKLPTGMCVFSPSALAEHRQDLAGRGRFGAWQRHDLLKRNVEELRVKIPQRCGLATVFLQGEAEALKAELEAIDSRTLAARGVKGEREMHKKLDPLDKRARQLSESVSTLCAGGGKLSCVPAGQLPGAGGVVTALAPAAPASGPALALQPAGTAIVSDLVGLTKGDGITVGTWDRRPRVERLQQRLNDKGAALTPDGMFGAQTATALRQLQARNGVPEQDTVDPATAQALEGGSDSGAAISRLEGLRHNDGITFGTWHLRPHVSELQGRLTGHGFPCAVDGMFGDRTLASLNAFQSLHTLPPAPVVDRGTADALEGRGDQPQCPQGEVPIPDLVLA